MTEHDEKILRNAWSAERDWLVAVFGDKIVILELFMGGSKE